MGHNLIVRKDAAVVGVVAALLVSCLPKPTFQLMAVVLWRYLVVRQKHFVLPLCLAVTDARASAALLSARGGVCVAVTLWVLEALPFGRQSPWMLWLEADPEARRIALTLSVFGDQGRVPAGQLLMISRRPALSAHRAKPHDLTETRAECL